MTDKIQEQCLSHLDYIDHDTDISIINLLLEDYTLTPNQLTAVKNSYLTKTKSAIESIEMGLGKTIISLGLLQMIAPAVQNSLAIIVAQTNTIENFYKSIITNTSLNVIQSTGQADEVKDAIRNIQLGLVNCLVVTPSAWTLSEEFNMYVFNNTSKIRSIIWDECKGVNDYGFNHFIEASRYVDFVFPLNATITGKGVDLVYKMLYACKATDLTFSRFKRRYGNTIGSRTENETYCIDWDSVKKDFDEYFINFNREDVGASTIYKYIRFHRCYTTDYQNMILKETGLREVLYAPMVNKHTGISTIPAITIPSISAIVRIISEFQADENSLIYCLNREPANVLYNLLTNMGYKVFRIDGHTTPTAELKMESEEGFNNTRGAIMITSLGEGSNLNSASHVIVFQTPSEVLQYIARAARGFNEKEITLDWIHYPELEQESLFRNIESAIDVGAGSDRQVEVLHAMMSEAEEMYPNDGRLSIYRNRIQQYNL